MDQRALSSAAETVLTFLESVGRRSEAELYLRLFRELPKESFALVAVEPEVLHRSVGSLLEDLQFLADLGLMAPLVLGALGSEAAETQTRELRQQLGQLGLEPTWISMAAPEVGEQVARALGAGQLPLICFEPDRQGALLDRFEALGRLAEALRTRKVVILRQRGRLALLEGADSRELERRGLVGPAGELSVVSLRTDRELLLGRGLLPRQDEVLLESLMPVLERGRNSRLTVSVTSPLNLLRELFTVHGDGTLVKLGCEIVRYHSYAEVDCQRLRQLLEQSFGRSLRSDFFQRPPISIYLEPEYRGVAIVEPSSVAPYLTKLAVEPVAQGEGIGRDLWQVLVRDHTGLFWRARPDNPINAWYVTLCDGLVRLPDWHVYWRGLDPEQIPEAIEQAAKKDPDFVG